MSNRCLLTLAIILIAPNAWAHGGGLDKYGCHTNRKTGDYHCHRAPATTPPPASNFSSSRAVNPLMSQAPPPATTSGQNGESKAGWVGDRKALVYFKGTCEAAKAIPDERRVTMTYENSFTDLGYRRSREPGC